MSNTKWEVMENEFFKRIPEEPSYESWQRNRRYFYKIMDREFREAEKLEKSKVEVIAKKRSIEDSHIDVIATDKRIKIGSSQRLIGNMDKNFRSTSDNLNEVDLDRKNSQNQSPNSSDQDSLQRNCSDNDENQFKPVCRHCSHHSSHTVRHLGPFKGRENCLYDPRGNFKMRFSFQKLNSKSPRNPRKDYIHELVRTGQVRESNGEIHVLTITDTGASKVCQRSNYNLNDSSRTPYLKCRFTNPRMPENSLQGKIVFDSGSPYSIIHYDNLRSCQHKIVGKRESDYFGAGGEKLPLEDYLVDVCIEIADKGTWILKKVLVTKSDVKMYRNQLIFGRYDMNRLKVVLDLSETRVKFDLPTFDKIEPEWLKLTVEKDVNRQNFVAKIEKLKFELDEYRKRRKLEFGN